MRVGTGKGVCEFVRLCNAYHVRSCVKQTLDRGSGMLLYGRFVQIRGIAYPDALPGNRVQIFHCDTHTGQRTGVGGGDQRCADDAPDGRINGPCPGCRVCSGTITCVLKRYPM